MLSKKYRFHSRGGVRYVYQKGKTVRRPQMSLVSMENTRGFTRVAVVVSKKISKSAVERNRIRRRVYEAVRVNLDALPKKRDYIFVVFQKEVEKIPFGELERLLGELVEAATIMWYNYCNGQKECEKGDLLGDIYRFCGGLDDRGKPI